MKYDGVRASLKDHESDMIAAWGRICKKESNRSEGSEK